MKKSKKSKKSHGLSMLSLTLATSAAIGAQAFAAAAAGKQAGAATAGNAQDSRALQFKIASGPLDDALVEFRKVTGLKVVLAEPRIGGVQSPGASGTLTAERAMEALLNGTGVRATFSKDSVSLDIQSLSQFVSVLAEPLKLSSPKYFGPLRDTPQTVVVIPQQVFLQQNAASLRDVLRNTPGITMSIGEGGSGGTSTGDNLLVRGFSARNDIFIDGARDVGLVNRDAYNVESVEVSKGPSSAVGGRGVTGGSINLVTKSPEQLNHATVRVVGGNADYKRATFDVNHTLTDSIGFRLNGMKQDSGYAGRDIAKYRSWGLAPSLALGLGKPTKLTLSYSRMQQNNIPDFGLPTLLPDVAIAKGITVNDLDFHNFYGIASRDYEITKSDSATATVEHQFNDTFAVRNMVRYGKNYRDAVLTPPRPATTAAGQGLGDPGYDPAVAQIRRTDTKYQHRNDRIATNQTDFTIDDLKTGFLEHDADIGIEVNREHQPTYAFTDLFTNGRPPVDDLFNPTPNATYNPAFAKTGATTDAHAKSVALYAFDAMNLGSHFVLDLGVRWDHVNVDYKTVAATTAAGLPGAAAQFGRIDKALSGRTGILYKPVTKGSIYASYSTSFTPSFDGTLGLTLAATGINSQALPPEETRNIEVGTKWDLLKNLSFTAAFFDTDKTNAKTTALSGATVLAGDQEVRGVEFSLSGNITSRLGVFGGLSLMDGKVRESGIPTEVGVRLPYVPKASFNLWSSYQFPFGLSLGGGANYSSGNFFNQTGGFLFVAGGTVANPKYVENAAAVQALTRYWIFSTSASYPVNKHLTLQVNGTNLANEKYADRAYDRHFLPGPGRQILAGPVINW